jgi:hypothetical protein
MKLKVVFTHEQNVNGIIVPAGQETEIEQEELARFAGQAYEIRNQEIETETKKGGKK